MTKKIILATVNALPDHVTLDELIERLIFIEKVEEGFTAINHGESKTHEEVVKLVQSWQK